MEQLHIKVKEKMEPINPLFDIEDILSSFGGCINFFDLGEPSTQVMLLSSGKGLLEVVANLLKLLALMKVLPVLTKDILDSAHVDTKSSLDLLSPKDLV